jgi:hypothetical protein
MNIATGEKEDENEETVNDMNAPKGHIACHYTVYTFLSKLLKKIEIRCEGNDSNKDFAYFMIPPICFLLTNQTMNSFWQNVERDSTHSKILSLISETDYFIYEMFYNNRLMRNVSNSTITRILYNINIFHCEVINYCAIVIQNIILLVHFFYDKDGDGFTDEEKYKLHPDNIAICVIQLCFLVFLMSVWIKYKFYLYFQHNLMKIYNKKFIYKQEDELNNNKILESNDSMVDNFNSDIGIINKIKVGLVDTILGNKEVNIFVFTLILIILYLSTGSALFLVLPTLFVANLSSILFGIILAVKLRYTQISAVLIYTYIVVYCFTWFDFYFYYDSWSFDDMLSIANVIFIIYN